jgi:hypothetical protein
MTGRGQSPSGAWMLGHTVTSADRVKLLRFYGSVSWTVLQPVHGHDAAQLGNAGENHAPTRSPEVSTTDVKVKLSLCLNIKHYAMKMYGGVDVQIHVFLTSALVGGEW